MISTRRKLKNRLLNCLNIFGVIPYMRWINRHKVIILVVHGVADKNSVAEWRPLRPPLDLDVFHQQIETISQHYNLVTYDDAVAMISGNAPLVAYSIAITFDDGYLNNLKYALPVLQQYDMKPIFFVATAFTNNKKTYWFDRFDYVIQHLQQDVELSIEDNRFVFEAGDRNSLKKTYSELRSCAKKTTWSNSEFTLFFEKSCERMEKSCGRALSDIQQNDSTSATLTDSDMLELTRANHAIIGSHTVDHVRLDIETSEQVTDQLLSSKSLIESVIGEDCEHFCYPNGGVDQRSRNLVAEAGYKSACTSEPGLNRVGDDCYMLRRVHLPNSKNAARLLSLLSGTTGLISKLTGVLRK